MGHRGSAEEEAVGDGEDGAEVDEAPDEDECVGEVRVGVGDAVFASFFFLFLFFGDFPTQLCQKSLVEAIDCRKSVQKQI